MQLLSDIIRNAALKRLGKLDENTSDRLAKETVVRILKRTNCNCIHKEDSICSDRTFRCGERDGRCKYNPSDDKMYALIVDDEKDLRLLYSEILSDIGFCGRIDSAANVSEAIDILNKGKKEDKQYGLIISDIRMPVFTGYDLVNFIADRNFNSRVILVSGTLDHSKPPIYFGDVDIVPGHKIVSGEVQKSGSVRWMSDLENAIKATMESYKKNYFN